MASMVSHFEKIKDLHDVQHPLLTPELVLVEWSKKLSQDYKTRTKNKIEAMDQGALSRITSWCRWQMT
ncbi:hypothetical protein ACHAWO_003491 [Cyclotella atomus]|uniref:Uncharacterized protein n=1 Tax=Cyclotella atomus TaxID=382360 RepID=A0ABD3PJ25_9STRA